VSTSPTNPPAPPAHFADRLAAALDRAGAPACVGLDPVLERLPAAIRAQRSSDADKIEEYCLGVIDAVAPHVTVVKPQSACFERYGDAGVRVLHNVIAAARSRGMLIVLDAKRGDIGVTADHYAHAAFDHFAADALTVSPYLGPDTIEPFLKHPGRGVFVLVRTSNPGSDAIQAQRLADGRTIAHMMADMVTSLGQTRRGGRGLSDVGAVVGATKAAEGAQLRARMRDQVFLVPGYGAQGGTLDDVRVLVRPGSRSPGDSGVLVTASRSVIYAFAPGEDGWQEAVRAAAAGFVAELAQLHRA
jgi:orotidine-5'-phosphate decarboxylase